MKHHSGTPQARRALVALLLAVTVAAAYAGPRTSTNYSIATDTADSGGARATSTNLSSWTVLAGPIPGSSGTTTVADPDAGPVKFYRVEVTKP